VIRRSLAMFGLSVFALAGVAAAHAEEAAAPTAEQRADAVERQNSRLRKLLRRRSTS